ncbi:MAG: M20/M25/M40 family metallo-hydrolase [Symbiobacteriaceae bacterium]|nr:M20/M25/M40 family metallo-hydrolase [Symbiobacteriaceae bacterium]
MKEALRELIKELTAIEGISGQEQKVVRAVLQHVRPLVDEVSVDCFGNIVAIKHGGEPGPKVLIAAHTDEIGAIVKSIERNGWIRFEKIGGTGDALLLGRQVAVNGHFGLVGVKAGHFQTPRERTEVKPASDLYIDVGCSSDAEVLALGIKPGDPICHWPYYNEFSNSDYICSKALDDRVGCAILIQLLRELKEPFAGTLYAVFTVQEEVGLRGAQVAAYNIKPDFAIAVDTVPSGDTPDINFIKELPVSIGQGPLLQLMSRTFIMNPLMKKVMLGVCERSGAPYQVALFTGGNTDAAAMHLQAGGILSAAITIPRRYSHSPIEAMDLNDCVSTMVILQQFLKDMGGFGNLAFEEIE